MKRLLSVCAALGALALAPAAGAQPPSTEEVQEHVDSGARLFRVGEYERALGHFQRALDASGEQALRYPMARCQQALGRDREALASFRAFLAVPDIPPEARGKARMAVQLLEAKLASGTLILQVSPFGARIFVDDEEVGEAPLEPLDLAPGQHEVRAETDGHEGVSKTVHVAAGSETTTTIALSPLLASDGAGDGAGPPPSASPWQWVTLGGGLALAAGGGALWWLGDKDYQDVEDGRRSGTMSLERAQDLRDSGDKKLTAAYVLVGVGGAALVTSTVLFVLDATLWDGPQAEIQVPRPAVWGRPGSVVFGLEGSF